MTKMYYPAGGINNMFVWTYNKGYKIKVSEDVFLPMNGCQEPNTTVNLEATWNLLPVLSQCEVDPIDLFAPVSDKLIMIKDVAGSGVYWPELSINTMENLQPGKAYFAAVSQNTSVTYDPCETLKSVNIVQEVNAVNDSPWQNPEKTASAHAVAIPSDALTDFESGDYIAAFGANGLCFGLTRIGLTTENQLLTLFGNDPMTGDQDGFLQGEEIFFRAYQHKSGDVVELIAAFSPDYSSSDGKFAGHGISVIDDLKLSPSDIVETSSRVQFYPNPATGQITFKSGSNENVKLIISNMQGNVLHRTAFNHSTRVDVSGFARGIYFVTLLGDDFTSSRKLILN
jgi:hypothetical protein